MSHSDQRVVLGAIAVLMVVSAGWFVSPWPLVALAGMGFSLLLASAWVEQEKAVPEVTGPEIRRMPPPEPWKRPDGGL